MKVLILTTGTIAIASAIGIGLLSSWSTLFLTVLFPIFAIGSLILTVGIVAAMATKSLGGIEETFNKFAA